MFVAKTIETVVADSLTSSPLRIDWIRYMDPKTSLIQSTMALLHPCYLLHGAEVFLLSSHMAKLALAKLSRSMESRRSLQGNSRMEASKDRDVSASPWSNWLEA